MVSLPIPDKTSPIRYEDIRWQKGNLGPFVSDLTGGNIPASHFAHLDPDLNASSLSRPAGWRPQPAVPMTIRPKSAYRAASLLHVHRAAAA